MYPTLTPNHDIRPSPVVPHNVFKAPLTDFEWGGVGISDVSQGSQVQIWELEYAQGSGDVILKDSANNPTTIYNVPSAVWLSFTFDQNLRWLLVYQQGADPDTYLRWYDPVSEQYETLIFSDGQYKTPFLVMDDTRDIINIGRSDILLSYVKC